MKISKLLMGLGIIFDIFFVFFLSGSLFVNMPTFVKQNNPIIISGLFSVAITSVLLALIRQEFEIAKEDKR